MKGLKNTILVVCAMLLGLAGSSAAVQVSAQSGDQSRSFPETGKTVQGKLLQYWDAHGGLAQQGYPISSEIQERNATDGKTYTVQYFERAVFELHPEQSDPQYQVLLSLLGNFTFKEKYRDGRPPGQKPSTDNAVKYEQTGHVIGGKFRTYWEQHGGLAQQGYPISDEFQEVSDLNGKTYTVQYFERAVFEFHPENAGSPYEVLLAQLGRFRYEAGNPSPAMNAAVDKFLTTVPDSFYAVGTIAAVKDMLASRGAVLYDLRGVEAYNAGHIPGAVNLPIRTLAQNLDKIPTDKPVLLSCGAGYLAAMGVAVLQTLGYSNVKAFPGSYDAWAAAHEPVSQDAVPPTVYGPSAAAPALIAQADTFLRSLPDDFLGIGTVPALKEAMANGALLVDVRPAGMYGEGHIPGAINIPIQQLPANLDKIPRDKLVVVSCGSGYLTGMALAALQLRGYTNVRSFPPSYDGWKAANQPVEK